MSTTITSAYDNLITLIQTALPGHKRLLSVYTLEDNPESILTQGYGIKIGAAKLDGESNYALDLRRDFSFLITRKIFALDSNAVGKASAEKQIIEDQIAALKVLTDKFTLNDVVLTTRYEGDGGVDFLSATNDSFLKLETSLSVKYLEQLN